MSASENSGFSLPDGRGKPARGTRGRNAAQWRSLYWLNAYRILLGGIFVGVVMLQDVAGELGGRSIPLFVAASAGFAALGALSLVTAYFRWPDIYAQTEFQVGADLLLITLALYASGGVGSGLGLLMVVSVAAGGVILSGRVTLFFASVATILILLEHTYSAAVLHLQPLAYPQVGLLGLGLLATAFTVSALAQRIRRSEQIAESQAIDLANMAQLNAVIIEQLRTGVAVTDRHGKVLLMNRMAEQLLGIHRLRLRTGEAVGRSIEDLCIPIAHEMQQWQRNPHHTPAPLHAWPAGPVVIARFARIGQGHGRGVLVFLNDATALQQQAQQLKLAALGRLSAGIAHEIRNPLSALSHAGELLGEGAAGDAEHKQLVRIIQQHSQRINEVIENVLQLGRRDRARAEPLELRTWLRDYAEDFVHARRMDRDVIRIEGPHRTVRIDPAALRQILTNLCENAVRHSPPYTGEPLVELFTGWDQERALPTLDVVDRGSGIPDDIAEAVFEPFFTTRAEGTGLGLYIARELCESNDAQLSYSHAPEGGSRFRILFNVSGGRPGHDYDPPGPGELSPATAQDPSPEATALGAR